MSEKSETLRQADALEISSNHGIRREAAAKLRRLHEENAELRKANATFGQRQEWWNERMFALEQQRDALLKALIGCRDRFFPVDQPKRDRDLMWEPVNAAIKAVEEGK